MRASSAETNLRVALSTLGLYGILLESHAKLPSISTIVIGKAIRGSWWAHPKGHEIHYVALRIATHPDVVVTKLISSRVTYVHRKLWPALAAVGSARQDWQLIALSSAALQLLALVDKAGRVRTDRMHMKLEVKGKTIGDVTRELEGRLLVVSREVHTETGKHAKELETWKSWRMKRGIAERQMLPGDAKKRLEKALANLNSRFDAQGTLPWI
jgi:hypothetical protein